MCVENSLEFYIVGGSLEIWKNIVILNLQNAISFYRQPSFTKIFTFY